MFRARRAFALAPCIALLFASACAGSLALTPIQSSSKKPSNVAVYFRVETGKGEPVANLEADQFNIYEDDKLVSTYESKQTILNPEVAAAHYTLLLVDMSGSVAESDGREKVAAAAEVFTAKVSTNNRVAVYAFDGSEDLYKITGFTQSGDRAQGKLQGLANFEPKDPSTNLNGAMVKALAELDEALDGAKEPLKFGTLVVFTDGTDRAARVSQEEVAEALEQSKHEVFAIGLGAELSEEDLDRVGKDGTALATDEASIGDAFEAVAEHVEATTKSYYLLSYCSPARAGDHTVRVEAVVPNDKGKEQKGDLESEFNADGFGPKCDPNTKPDFDVSKGETLLPEDEREAKPKRRLFGGGKSSKSSKPGGKASAKASASASAD